MILKLSLLLVLDPALKREVFLRSLSFFILLRNQYILIGVFLVSFLPSCGLFSIQLFAKLSSPSV